MLHSDDYVARLVPLFNVAVRLDNLFQRVASVNHRFDRAELVHSLPGPVGIVPEACLGGFLLEPAQQCLLSR